MEFKNKKFKIKAQLRQFNIYHSLRQIDNLEN